MTGPHARTFDIPGWPCPPRVSDIPNHPGSWGYLPTHGPSAGGTALAQDDLGYLWVLGAAVPKFRVPRTDPGGYGAVGFWTPAGLGLWIHRRTLPHLGSVSRLDMRPDEWVPVREVAADLPEFIRSE